MVIPIENVVVLPGVGSLSRLLGIALVLVVIPALLGRGYINLRRQTVAVLLFALYVLWAFAGLLWTIELDSTIGYVFTFIQLLVLVAVVWQVCVTDSDQRAVQQAYVIGATLAVADGFRNFLIGNEAVFQRFSVSNTDPNEYALVLALGIPLAWILFSKGVGWMRILNLLYVPLALSAILLSGSRGGALAALVALLVFPLGLGSLDRFGRRTLVAFLVASLAVVPFVWGEVTAGLSSNLERISSLGAELSTGTLSSRRLIWDEGIAVVTQSPLLGVGGGAFPAAIERSSGLRELAHNTFLSIMVETGAVGLLLFVAILVVTLLPLLRNFGPATMPGVVLLGTLMVGITPLSWEFRKPTWLIIALLLLMSSIQLGRNGGRKSWECSQGGQEGHGLVPMRSKG